MPASRRRTFAVPALAAQVAVALEVTRNLHQSEQHRAGRVVDGLASNSTAT